MGAILFFSTNYMRELSGSEVVFGCAMGEKTVSGMAGGDFFAFHGSRNELNVPA